MGLQLIFVVETNKKCNSDWNFLKEAKNIVKIERMNLCGSAGI